MQRLQPENALIYHHKKRIVLPASQAIEKVTRHDVKAVEYFLKEKVAGHKELQVIVPNGLHREENLAGMRLGLSLFPVALISASMGFLCARRPRLSFCTLRARART